MKSWIGLGILGAVVVASIAYVAIGGLDFARRRGPRAPTEIAIYYGGEKTRFLKNPDVQRVLREQHGVALDAIKAGSIEMTTTLDPQRVDCIWPSNSVAVELARRAGRPVLTDENIFSSPIVFFAWAEVADALEAKGVVTTRRDGVMAADLQALVGLIEGGARWREDLGLNIYGPVKILSTDPTRSNSGAIWAALLATSLNGGETPTAADMPELTPKIVAYFAAMGHMADSSGDIFESFLKQGVGSLPIIVGYENQMIEFLIENEEYAELIRDKIRIIYPEPTIFASHPLIAMDEKCGVLIEALRSEPAQIIAWRGHGFRTGITNDPSEITAATLPQRISLVAPMPSAAVMEEILASLK